MKLSEEFFAPGEKALFHTPAKQLLSRSPTQLRETFPPSHLLQVRPQLANIEPDLVIHREEIHYEDEEDLFRYFSHTHRTAFASGGVVYKFHTFPPWEREGGSNFTFFPTRCLFVACDLNRARRVRFFSPAQRGLRFQRYKFLEGTSRSHLWSILRFCVGAFGE